MKRVVVLIPTYNEVENIAAISRAVLAQGAGFRVMVLDDASPDGTADAAEAVGRETGRVEVMRRGGPRGLGAAYLEGFRRVLGWGDSSGRPEGGRPEGGRPEAVAPEVIVTMDADFSHDPGRLQDMVAALDEAEVSVGSRYVPGGGVARWPLRRILLSRFANWYARTVTRTPVRDITAGFIGFRREALASLPLDRIRSRGYAFLVELKTWCVRRGLRIRELPIIFTDRRAGTAKMSWRQILSSATAVWRA